VQLGKSQAFFTRNKIPKKHIVLTLSLVRKHSIIGKNVDFIGKLHGKNAFFAEGSKILLTIDLKIILLDHQNNLVVIFTLKIMNNVTKNFDF